MTYEYKQYLSHHGIKGQKWGVRRYQNEDGTLTIEGKKRYGSSKSEPDTWKKEEAKDLSNEELDRRNARMQKENTYKQNIENRHPAQKEAKNIGKKIFMYSAVGAATALMSSKYKDALAKIGKKKLEDATKDAVKDTATKVVEKTVKKAISSGKKFFYENRSIFALGVGAATYKGAEYWKKKNDEAGKDNTFSDFAYKHRADLSLATYVLTKSLAKHLYKG